VVDDRFPYDRHKETWAFSRCGSAPEIWVLILEKAWAKVYGSYQRIEAGTTGEALQPLTGCPTKYFIHDEWQNKERLWETIKTADERNWVMCCAVASMAEEEIEMTAEDMKTVGLVDAHAYSLIKTREIRTRTG
jgi:calpain-15